MARHCAPSLLLLFQAVHSCQAAGMAGVTVSWRKGMVGRLSLLISSDTTTEPRFAVNCEFTNAVQIFSQPVPQEASRSANFPSASQVGFPFVDFDALPQV